MIWSAAFFAAKDDCFRIRFAILSKIHEKKSIEFEFRVPLY